MASSPVEKPVDPGLRYWLEAKPGPHGGHACKTCGIVNSLEGDDAEALRAFLADSSVTTAHIRRALDRIGVKVSQSAVARHRKDCL